MNTLQSRHPNLYTKAPREQWDETAAALRSGIPSLSDTQVAMEMARIAAMAGDGHTFVNLRTSPLFTALPLRLQWFEEGWVATTVPGDQPAMLGTVVIRLDTTPMEEVIEKIRPYVAYENEWWFRVQVLNYLISPEILANLGVQLSRNAITINDEWLVPATAPSVTAGPILAQPRFPLWTRYNGLNYWFHYLAESRTIYVKYNVCAEMPVLPAARFRAELAAALADNAVERIVLDVRTNTGGNSAVLARLLPPVPGGVKRVVITGRQTFSSGLWAASDLSRAGWTLVGEPTGGKPSSFGEVVGFTLPHSGLRGQVSTRYFTGPVQTQSDTLRPDVLAPWTWAGFSRELDVFLEAALAVN